MKILTPQDQIKEKFMEIANGGVTKYHSHPYEEGYRSFDKKEAEKKFTELVELIKKHF